MVPSKRSFGPFCEATHLVRSRLSGTSIHEEAPLLHLVCNDGFLPSQCHTVTTVARTSTLRISKVTFSLETLFEFFEITSKESPRIQCETSYKRPF